MDTPLDQNLNTLIDNIQSDLILAHNNKKQENYSFLTKRLKADYHERIILRFQSLFSQKEESTDLNYDRARVIFFSAFFKKRESVVIWFSLVGKYLTFFDRNNKRLPLNMISTEIKTIASEEGYHIISGDLLDKKLPIFNRISIWNALFSEL